MIHLRLCKGLSYSGVVAATRLKPDVFIDDEETAEAAVATGYFRRMEDEKIVPPPVNPTGTITKSASRAK